MYLPILQLTKHLSTIMKYLIGCIISLGWANYIVCQGPLSGFLPGRNKTDIALNFAYDSYNEYLFGDERQPINTITRSVSLYAEHGITDSLSIVATLPYMWTNPDSASLQDATLFLKYRNQYQRFSTGSLSILSAVGISLPVGDYRLDAERPIGSRNTTFQGRLIVQYNLNNGLFFHLQSGLDLRINPDSQVALPILLRTGWGTKFVYGEAWTEFRRTFTSAADTSISQGSGSNWIRVGATIYYPITKNLGLTAAIARFINGRNIGLSTMYSTGLVYRHDWNP